MNSDHDNVARLNLAKQSGSNEPRDGEFGERLARIEAQMKYMATREDVAEVKNLIIEKEATTMRWLARFVTTASISLLVAVIGLLAALIRTFS